MSWTERRSLKDRGPFPFAELPPVQPPVETAGQRAMRMNDMLIGQVCVNMLEGRDAFFGTGQFVEASDGERRLVEGGRS